MAEMTLPPQLADDLVSHSTVFMQPVVDLLPTRIVGENAVLIGDAAGMVRPHTASGWASGKRTGLRI